MTRTNIVVQASFDGDVSRADVRSALSGLDVSASSPVSSSGDEVGIHVNGSVIELRVEGFATGFTKTSEKALTAALAGLDGVSGVSVTEGGYSGDDSDGDDSDGDDDEAE